ncbi:MAG: hypothetical protein QOE93_1027 [Actinomycetota bacterium]|jgi:hypothetical protein|nr:hypothetical protein [Actinomycetota bacterium]
MPRACVGARSPTTSLAPDDVGVAIASLVLEALLVRRDHVGRLLAQSQALLVPKRP